MNGGVIIATEELELRVQLQKGFSNKQRGFRNLIAISYGPSPEGLPKKGPLIFWKLPYHDRL